MLRGHGRIFRAGGALLLGLALPAVAGCRLLPLGRTPPPHVTLATVADPDAPPAPAEPAPGEEEHEAAAESEHEAEEPEGLPPAAEGVAVASHYASLDRPTCEAELRHRKVAFTRVEEARGVVAPVRLDGPLGTGGADGARGVKFRSNLPAAKARVSPYDVYDCRLVLALDDFARILSRHDVVEVVHLSVWRPVSSKTVLKGPGRRHSGALAIDAALFKLADGRVLNVEKDFHGRIGARPCPAPESASELRKIACEANHERLFNVLLTPDYNWAHRNHFHLEVTAGARWTFVR